MPEIQNDLKTTENTEKRTGSMDGPAYASAEEAENVSHRSLSKMGMMKTFMGFFALGLAVSAFEKVNGPEAFREWKDQAIETIQPIREEMGKYVDQKIEDTQNTAKRATRFAANVVAEGTGINQMIDLSKKVANKLNAAMMEKQNEARQTADKEAVAQSTPKETPHRDPSLKTAENVTAPVQVALDKTNANDSTTRSEDGSRSHPTVQWDEMVHLSAENLKDLVWRSATELKEKRIEDEYQSLTSLHTMPLSEKEMADIRKNVERDHMDADFDYELKIWHTLIDQREREMKDPFAEDPRDDLQKMGLSKEMDQALQDAVSWAGECKRGEVAEKRFQDRTSLSTIGISAQEEEQMRRTIGNDLKTKSVDYELGVLEGISEQREFEMQGIRKRPSDLRALEANDSQKSSPLKDQLSKAVSDQASEKGNSDIKVAMVRNMFQKKDR